MVCVCAHACVCLHVYVCGCVPDDVQADVGVVEFCVHAVVVQRDDIVELGHVHVHVSVVLGVQGDAAHADPVGEEQVGLRRVVT